MIDSRAQAVEDRPTADDLPTWPDDAKLGELLLLVAQELKDDPFGGATKVTRCFFAEFGHMRLTGVR